MVQKAVSKSSKKDVVNTSKALNQYRRLTETRYEMAKQIYEHQDSLTKEVIDRIRDRLVIASTGVVNIGGKPMKLEQQYIDFNILFLACEILSDLALMNVQIANFKPYPMWCIECKKEIAGVKIAKKKRR